MSKHPKRKMSPERARIYAETYKLRYPGRAADRARAKRDVARSIRLMNIRKPCVVCGRSIPDERYHYHSNVLTCSSACQKERNRNCGRERDKKRDHAKNNAARRDEKASFRRAMGCFCVTCGNDTGTLKINVVQCAECKNKEIPEPQWIARRRSEIRRQKKNDLARTYYLRHRDKLLARARVRDRASRRGDGNLTLDVSRSHQIETERECLACRAVFQPSFHYRKCCSESCKRARKAYYDIAKTRYYETNRETRLAYYRRHRELNREANNYNSRAYRRRQSIMLCAYMALGFPLPTSNRRIAKSAVFRAFKELGLITAAAEDHL